MNNDVIRREAAINTVFSMCCRWNTSDPEDLKNMLMTAFQDLPSAQRKGKWILEHDDSGITYGECSECGMKNYAGYTNFCPSCGAKMEMEHE